MNSSSSSSLLEHPDNSPAMTHSVPTTRQDLFCFENISITCVFGSLGLRLGWRLRLLGGRHFGVVEIAEGLRSQLEGQVVVHVLVFRLDRHFVQRDDARQGSNATHKLTHLVI